MANTRSVNLPEREGKSLFIRRLWILGFLGLFVGFDQWTKALAQSGLRGRPVFSYLGDVFRFQYAENPGAFLSLGDALSDAQRFWLLTVIVGAVLFGCLAYVLWYRLDRVSTIGLSLVVSGGFSNFLDRLLRTSGRVIDFMNMGIGSLRTGVFNVADMAIMGGVACLLIQGLKDGRKQS